MPKYSKQEIIFTDAVAEYLGWDGESLRQVTYDNELDKSHYAATAVALGVLKQTYDIDDKKMREAFSSCIQYYYDMNRVHVCLQYIGIITCIIRNSIGTEAFNVVGRKKYPEFGSLMIKYKHLSYIENAEYNNHKEILRARACCGMYMRYHSSRL